MIAAYSVEDVRRAEAEAMSALSEGTLMQRAAASLAAVVAQRLTRVYAARVALLVGPGSNGGDAVWAGALLARRGADVTALLTVETGPSDALAALRAAGGRIVPAGSGPPDAARAALDGAHVVVDGLLGIGGRPGLTGVAAVLAAAIPDDALVVAVDLPSGVDPGTGELPDGEQPGRHVWADLTVTFGVAKPGLLLPPADRAAGEVVLAGIGLAPPESAPPVVTRWDEDDVAAAWPVPGPASDKYARGVLGVVAGGAAYPGAAVLCTGAALAAGAGMVRYVGPPATTEQVRGRWPEVVAGPGRVQAWVLGPGVNPDPPPDQPHDQPDEQVQAVLDALAGDLPCVVDAGALGLVEELRHRSAATLLTPHAGELARLLSALAPEGEPDVARAEVEAAPLRAARRAAEFTGATVLLKGATCVIVAPDGRVRAQPDGPHWLATAGSGDVLAGIAGALLAAGLDPLDAATAAVAVHGRAGERANPGGPVTAQRVLAAVPGAIAAVLTAAP